MEETNRPVLPENIKRFMKNIKNGNLHNIYYIRSVDKEGNITGEAYGKNLLTDYGLSIITSNYSSTFASRMFLSTSQTPPELGVSTLTDIFGPAGTAVDQSAQLYPIEYDPDKHTVSQTWFNCSCFWDYNYSGVTEPVDIYSFGLTTSGGSSSQIVYHSLIYDEHGQPTHITKNPNERLYISAYITAFMDFDIIDDIKRRNKMNVIISPTYFIPHYSGYINITPLPSTDQTISDYNKYAVIMHNVLAMTGPVSAEHTISKSTTTDVSRTYESTYDSIIGLCISNDPSHIIGYKFNIKRSTPETLSTELAQVDDINYNVIDKQFAGSASDKSSGIVPVNIDECVLPVSDFTITDMKRYNYKNHDWDVNVGFTTGVKTKYNYTNNTWDEIVGSIGFLVNKTYNTGRLCLGPILTSHPRANNVYVFMNPYPELELSKVEATQYCRLAFTDNYLDISSYVETPLAKSLDNIPNDCKNAKYIVQLGGNYTLKFYYAENPSNHMSMGYKKNQINIDRDTVSLTPYINDKTLCSAHDIILSSDTNSWIAFSNFVVFNPENSSTRKILDLSTEDTAAYTSGMLYGNDDYIVKFVYKTNQSNMDTIRIYDVSDPSVNTLPYTDITYCAGALSSIPISSSKLGYICAYVDNDSINTAYIIKYADANPSVIKTIGTDICMLGENSKYFVYHDTNVVNRTEFGIYDCTTDTVVETFYLPTSVTYTLTGIFVWKDHIYIQYVDSNNITNVYYHKALTGATQLTSVDESFPILTLWNKQFAYYDAYHVTVNGKDCRRYDSVDDVCVISAYSYTTSMRIITEDSTLSFGRYPSTTSFTSVATTFITTPHLKYTMDGKTLLLSGHHYYYGDWRSSAFDVYDLGRIIDKNFTLERIKSVQNSGDYTFGLLYKDYVAIGNVYGTKTLDMYPFERFIKLKMTGTTYTVSGYNNPFKFDYGMTFTGTITNDMKKVLHEVDVDNDKVNIVNRITNEVTQYNSQSDAASFLSSAYSNDPSQTFNIYLGTSMSDTTVGTFANVQNLMEFRTCPSVTGLSTDSFTGSTIKRFVVHPNTSYFETKNGAFSESGIEEFVISDTTELRGDSTGGMFSRSALKSFHVDNTETLFANREFAECGRLHSVYIDTTNMSSTKNIGQYAFAAAPILTNLTIIGALDSIGRNAFEGNGISNIEVTADVIETEAFLSGASDPKETVTLTLGGSSMTSIGSKAFKGNTNLKSITIPTVTSSIAVDAFDDIKEYLMTINVHDNDLSDAPWGTPIETAGVLYVPDGKLVIYGTGDLHTGLYENINATVIEFASTPSSIDPDAFLGSISVTDIYVPWAEGDIPGAPWGANNATVHYTPHNLDQ